MAGTGYVDRPGLLPGAVGWAVAYDLDGLEEGVHRGLPTPWLTFIVSVDDPVRVAGTAYDVVVSGLHSQAAMVEQPARQAGVQLAVHPLAARRLLGCSAAELAGATTRGEAVFGAAATELHDRVGTATEGDQRLDLVQDWMRRRADDSRPRVRPELVHAWTLVQRSRGRVRVDRLARDVGLSDRQLRSLMVAETGLSPKQLCRHARFESVVRGLASGTRPLAEIAAETGYADQAHLTREFGQMAGCSPTQWLVEERRNIQAGGHRGAGGSRHERDD